MWRFLCCFWMEICIVCLIFPETTHFLRKTAYVMHLAVIIGIPGIAVHCAVLVLYLASKVDGGITGSRLGWSILT